MNRLFFITFITAVIFSAAARLDAAPEMLIGVDRTLLYEGESLDYQILLSGQAPLNDSVTPVLSAFTDFDVQTFPQQRQTVGGTYIIKFSYVLTPKKTGTLTIPAPEVIADGKPLIPSALQIERQIIRDIKNGGEIPIAVRLPEVQDLVFLQVETNKNRIYPFQQLDLSVIVQIKALPAKTDPDGSMNPLQVLGQPPNLTIPWAVKDYALPKGFVPQQELNEWLTAINVRKPQRGFAVNNYESQGLSAFFDDDDFFASPFSAGRMFRNSPLQFLPKPAKIRRPDGRGNLAPYWEYRFSRSFVPQQIGQFSLGTVTVKGVFAEENPAAKQGVSAKEVYAFAPAVAVEVADVPEKDRPESYIGAVGKFGWSADIQPRKAAVGEPLTLTLQLKGQGSTVNVRPPDLTTHSEIIKNFKVYSPTEELKEDCCTFIYTIRPLQAGSIVFPSLSVSFFDTETESFVTRHSGPVELDVAAVPALQTAADFSNENPRINTGINEPERSGKKLFANFPVPGGAVNEAVDYVQWAAVMLSLILGYALFVSSVFLWRQYHGDPALLRRRSALGRAKKRLEPFRYEKSLPEDFSLQNIITDYIADLTDGNGQGMTAKDAYEKLRELGISESTSGTVRDFLEVLDASRFGGGQIPFQKPFETAGQLLGEIDRSVPSTIPGGLREKMVLQIVFSLLLHI